MSATPITLPETSDDSTTTPIQESGQQQAADSPAPEGQGNGLEPQGSPNDAQQGGTANAPSSFETHARAISEAMPDEYARDALAARVIAAGGVQGVDLVSDVPTADFAAHANGVQEHLQGLADAEVRRLGLEPQAFYTYLRNQGSGVVRAAALETYHLGKPGSTFNGYLAKFAGRQRQR